MPAMSSMSSSWTGRIATSVAVSTMLAVALAGMGTEREGRPLDAASPDSTGRRRGGQTAEPPGPPPAWLLPAAAEAVVQPHRVEQGEAVELQLRLLGEQQRTARLERL